MTCLLLKMCTWDSCTGSQSPVCSSQKAALLFLFCGGEGGHWVVCLLFVLFQHSSLYAVSDKSLKLKVWVLEKEKKRLSCFVLTCFRS